MQSASCVLGWAVLMVAPGQSHSHLLARRMLGCLGAGTWGGVAMLGWYLLTSLWQGRPFWSVPHLYASAMGPHLAYQTGFGHGAVCGSAIILFSSGLAGLLFAVVVRESHTGLRVLLLGLTAGLAWYYLLHGFLWPRWFPLLELYSQRGVMIPAHLLLGLSLGRYRTFVPRPWPPPAVPERQDQWTPRTPGDDC